MAVLREGGALGIHYDVNIVHGSGYTSVVFLVMTGMKVKRAYECLLKMTSYH